MNNLSVLFITLEPFRAPNKRELLQKVLLFTPFFGNSAQSFVFLVSSFAVSCFIPLWRVIAYSEAASFLPFIGLISDCYSVFFFVLFRKLASSVIFSGGFSYRQARWITIHFDMLLVMIERGFVDWSRIFKRIFIANEVNCKVRVGKW